MLKFNFGCELTWLPVEGPAFAVFFSQEAVGFRAVGHFHLLRVVVELLADVVGDGSQEKLLDHDAGVVEIA